MIFTLKLPICATEKNQGSNRIGTCYSHNTVKGGEWSFQKYGSFKIFVKFLMSRSLDFCADCQSLVVSNFCKVVSDYRSRSRILKGEKSRACKEKRQSRRHAKSRCYHLPPLLYVRPGSIYLLCVMSVSQCCIHYNWSIFFVPFRIPGKRWHHF